MFLSHLFLLVKAVPVQRNGRGGWQWGEGWRSRRGPRRGAEGPHQRWQCHRAGATGDWWRKSAQFRAAAKEMKDDQRNVKAEMAAGRHVAGTARADEVGSLIAPGPSNFERDDGEPAAWARQNSGGPACESSRAAEAASASRKWARWAKSSTAWEAGPLLAISKHDWREAKTWRPRDCGEGQQMVRKRLLLIKCEGNAQARP